MTVSLKIQSRANYPFELHLNQSFGEDFLRCVKFDGGSSSRFWETVEDILVCKEEASGSEFSVLRKLLNLSSFQGGRVCSRFWETIETCLVCLEKGSLTVSPLLLKQTSWELERFSLLCCVASLKNFSPQLFAKINTKRKWNQNAPRNRHLQKVNTSPPRSSRKKTEYNLRVLSGAVCGHHLHNSHKVNPFSLLKHRHNSQEFPDQNFRFK